jgi:hypothetical protein
MPIVTIPNPTKSWSNALTARSKAWAKRLDSVDRSKRDGYAFVGEFRNLGAIDEAPVGTFYMIYYDRRRGSGVMDSREVDIYKVTDDPGEPLKFVEGWNLGTNHGWALQVRDDIADLMEKDAHDHTSLREERKRLTARIAEIDKILGEEVADADEATPDVPRETSTEVT